MSTQQVMINSGRNDVRKNITLKSDTKLDEVIVTGIYTRKAEILLEQQLLFRAKI